MIPRSKALLLLIAASFAWAGPAAASAGAAAPMPSVLQTPVLEHNLVSKYVPGEKITLKAAARGGAEWVTLYFRTPGLKDFQARPMKAEAGSEVYEGLIDTSTFSGDGFEYYIEAEKGGGKIAVPAAGASGPAKVAPEGGEKAPQIPANLPPPQAEEAKFKLPVHANGSVLGAFQEDVSGTPMTSPTGNGNVQFGFEKGSAGGFGVRIDSNFSLTNVPPPTGRSINLASMMVTLTLGSHALRMGDLNINESEYSSFGLGRRGLEYAFDNRRFYVHAFDISSQQLQGFKGIGIPSRLVSILGGAAGVRLFKEAVFVKAVYVTGQDDPAQAANAASSAYNQSRQGKAWSVLQETSLFKNAVKLKAEFARSSYDGNLDDETGPAADGAWSAGGILTLGPLSLGATYRSIGRYFNSIGLQYLANDRKGVEGILLFALGRFSLQGQLTLQQDNVEDDETRPTTAGFNGNASLNLGLSSKLSLIAGLRMSDQKTRQGDGVSVLQDMKTDEVSGGFSWMASNGLSLNVTLTSSTLSSATAPSGDARGLTLNVGGSLRAGEALMLSPTFGLTRAKNTATGEVNTTLNAFLNGEVFFVPRILSLLVSGSFNRMAMAVISVDRTMDLIGGINFYLGKLIKVNNLLLTIKGNYRRTEIGGRAVTDTRILGQTDFAF